MWAPLHGRECGGSQLIFGGGYGPDLATLTLGKTKNLEIYLYPGVNQISVSINYIHVAPPIHVFESFSMLIK